MVLPELSVVVKTVPPTSVPFDVPLPPEELPDMVELPELEPPVGPGELAEPVEFMPPIMPPIVDDAPVVVATADVTVAVPLATVAETVAVEPPLIAETASVSSVSNTKAKTQKGNLLEQKELPTETIEPVSVPLGHD
jgi:hypothetical protein